MIVGLAAAGVVTFTLVALQLLRLSDRREDDRAGSRLRANVTALSSFDPKIVADLPDPARRYFHYAIRPGTPLRFTADLKMAGQLSLGTKEKPNYLSMRGEQVLRLDGFVWRVRAGRRGMWFSGSDGYVDGSGWTRFWLYDLVPVVRAGDDDDFARSAAGRAVAEAVFWSPAALLPSERVRWEEVDPDTARAVVRLDGHEHRVELTVAADGRPLAVQVLRWSRENRERVWRLQPFGGTIKAMLEVDGYRVAGQVEGGNWFGTPDYFPFYKARVAAIRLS